MIHECSFPCHSSTVAPQHVCVGGHEATQSSLRTLSHSLGRRRQRSKTSLFVNTDITSKNIVRNEAKLNFDKAFTDFVLFFVKANDAFHEEIGSKTVCKIETLASEYYHDSFHIFISLFIKLHLSTYKICIKIIKYFKYLLFAEIWTVSDLQIQ